MTMNPSMKISDSLKSSLKQGAVMGGKAASTFGKIQDWGTKHFQGTALDMNADLNMGMPDLNDSISDHLGLGGGSRSHHHKKKKKK